jgi:TRAP-type C4-dicarboxylate transport system substrate-binding protein
MRKPTATLLTAGLIAGLAAGPAAAQDGLQSTSLNVVGSWSSLQLHKKFEKPFWGTTIPEESSGKVQVELSTFDQQGLKGGEVFRLLDNGLFDIGATVADYTVQDAPELEGLDLPMMAPDIAEARKVAKAYKPVLDDALAKRFDAKLLNVVPYPQQVVFCNTPISSLQDLEGKKIRASGRTTAEFVNGVGAEGITMGFSEVPTALQRGVIDCAITGSLPGYSSGWYEMSTHLYALPVGGWDHVVTAIRQETWSDMNAATQDFLMAQNEAYENEVWDSAVQRTETGINCLTGNGPCPLGEAGDMTLVEAKEGDFELARKILKETILPNWAGRVDAQWAKRWNATIGAAVDLEAPVN